MRHRVGKKKMSRDMGQRQALLKTLSRALIIDGRIETTLAKAKFVQPYVEKLVTKAKRGPDFTNLSRVNEKVRSDEALRALFGDIASKFADRKGGYTRIVKLGFRAGDNAPMARIEWVADVSSTKKDSKKKVKPAKVDKKEAPEDDEDENAKPEVIKKTIKSSKAPKKEKFKAEVK